MTPCTRHSRQVYAEKVGKRKEHTRKMHWPCFSTSVRRPLHPAETLGEDGNNSIVVGHLFSHRLADNRRAVQVLLRLSEKHGKARLESAWRRALFFQRPLYAYVKNIPSAGSGQALNAGLEIEPLPGEVPPPPPRRT